MRERESERLKEGLKASEIVREDERKSERE